MPRSRSYSRAQVIDTAMQRFWHFGFEATSIDDLVRATGVSRHGLYTEFSGKEALFEVCLAAYSKSVVTPAFQQVEAEGATLNEVNSFFVQQIALAETVGLPGPGCLMANTMTEVAPHRTPVLALVVQHNDRLKAGFENALRGSVCSTGKRPSRQVIGELADLLVIFANGLWSVSRTVDDGRQLKRAVRSFLKSITARIST